MVGVVGWNGVGCRAAAKECSRQSILVEQPCIYITTVLEVSLCIDQLRVVSSGILLFRKSSAAARLPRMANLAEHAQFFDRLVDLVPPKYYHASDQELVNTKYLKKNAKAAAKQAMKQQGKQNKRAKLNPDTAQTSLQIQQQHAQQLQHDQDSNDEPALLAPEQNAASQSTAQKPGPAKTFRLPSSESSLQVYMRTAAKPCY